MYLLELKFLFLEFCLLLSNQKLLLTYSLLPQTVWKVKDYSPCPEDTH